MNNMLYTFLVGGAVRDMLLGITPQDKDYVVVGSDIQTMRNSGFQQVGNDFPVFLHPVTGEEYALARTETKNGEGYNGFETQTEFVCLEDDLARRDLTINSIAFDEQKQKYIDPFDGVKDIEKQILRHTSGGFAEDPVRVLRLARFAARYNWRIAEETLNLCRKMVKDGELNYLTKERVWKELSRALLENYPYRFFDTLHEVGALQLLFPEIEALIKTPENKLWHPEGNTYTHTMLVLQAATQFQDLDISFACLCHDLGKALTPENILPAHHGHEKVGETPVLSLCERLNPPSSCKEAALFSTRYHMHMHKLHKMRPKTIIDMLKSINGLRHKRNIEILVRVAVCDKRGIMFKQYNNDDSPYDLYKYAEVINSVKFNDLFPNGEDNVIKIQDIMLATQVRAIKAYRRNNDLH